jgi:hypothetical protein
LGGRVVVVQTLGDKNNKRQFLMCLEWTSIPFAQTETLLCLNFGDSIHPMPGNRLWVCSTEAWAAVGGRTNARMTFTVGFSHLDFYWGGCRVTVRVKHKS